MSANELQNLSLRIHEVGKMIAELELSLEANPHDLGMRLTLSSLRAHLDDLNRQAILLQAEDGEALAVKKA